ncbi:MAG: FAD-binding oxidoreductase [Sphingomonadaceae bacterium]|nr:FAD-binding oxidoreductase [Sphingomonadaceae bacterium]
MRNTDIIVIGGGIAGLSAVARLAAHRETILLEAEEAIGFHSSGRSATFCHFGIGDALVHSLTSIGKASFAESAAGDRTIARRMAALFIARAGERAELEALEMRTRRYSPDARIVAGEELTDIVPILKTGADGYAAGVFDPECYKLDSDAMLQAHARSLRDAGGSIVTDARATAIGRNGENWVVETAEESYCAPLLVNAAGSWADHIATMAGAATIGLQPLRRTIIAFGAPDDIDVSGWPFTKTIAGDGFYMLPEGSGRLLASPMDETPSAPCDAQPEEIDVATAAWRVEQGTTMTLDRIAHSWAGLRSFAPDNRPVAGFAADAPGFFWLAGQGGFGLQTSPAMAMASEALLLDQDWPEPLEKAGVAPEALSPARFTA